MGKGSQQRPAQISQEELQRRWEETFGEKHGIEVYPGPEDKDGPRSFKGRRALKASLDIRAHGQ